MINTNYPAGDFLIRLKNAARARRKEFTIRNTKLIKSIADALKRERFLEDVKESKGELTVKLTYMKKTPIFDDIVLVSKPGLRIYMGVEDLEKVKGPEVLIISTPQGVLSLKEALKKRVGGEVIAKVL
jgi:small subunit ribosomal protein S8